MSNSSLGNKIQDLQARIKAEIDSKDDLSPGAFMVPRPGSARKPKILGEIPLRSEGTPTRSRKQLDLPFMIPQKQETSESDTKLQEIMKRNGILKINGLHYNTALTDMEHLGDLGNGTCGHVVKMLHKPSDTVIAVKQMRRSGNAEENKRIIMDIEVVLKSHDCPYIVQCLGCFISASDVWICMELMSTCFDKLLKRLKHPIPEDILGKVTVATVKALSYLKERHGVIHRDVKPSNILLDERGRIKLCDFGISGRLVDSKAKTRSAGCAAYMAPERIDPPDPNRPDYDIRADVWSLGITLVELATGRFPYRDCSTDFEVLTRVLQEAPPSLPSKGAFSKDFQTFVTCCLTKNYKDRPKYAKLLNHDFVKYYEKENVSVDKWFSLAMQQADMLTNQRRFTSPPPSPNTRRHFAFHTRTPSEPRNQPDFQTQLELRNTPERLITNGTSVYNDLEVRSNGPSRSFTPNDFTLEGERVNNLPPINRMNKVSNSAFHQHDTRDTYNINNVYERNQISPFLSRRPVPEPEPTNGFWQVPQGSPLANRKRFQVFPDRFGPVQTSPRVLSGNTSPIVLERFYHQQNQRHAQAQQALVTHPPLAHEVAHLSPQHNEKEQGAVKRRFASYIKVHLGGHGRSTSPQSPGGAHAAGGVGAVVNHDRRRHQSPDPPPRYNRGTSETGASPLPLRRNYMDLVNVSSGSPNVLRRYPPVPQPPPRRLSESSSTPASPQHLRTRLHFTPEPLRRHYPPPELS